MQMAWFCLLSNCGSAALPDNDHQQRFLAIIDKNNHTHYPESAQ
jgi:hypothetical protein